MKQIKRVLSFILLFFCNRRQTNAQLEPISTGSNDSFNERSAGRRKLQQSGCSGGQNTPLRRSLLIDFVGFPSTVTTDEILNLQNTIRYVYNEVSDGLCGTGSDGFRTINFVLLSTDLSTLTSEDTSSPLFLEEPFTLEFALNGVCQFCLLTNAQLFVAESSCGGCRAPSETLFLEAFTRQVEDLVSRRLLPSFLEVTGLAEIERVFCISNYTEFKTNVLVDFVGIESTISGDDLLLLADAFRISYNSLNNLNTQACDLFFRKISDVNIVQDGQRSRRRYMQEIDEHASFVAASKFAYRFEVTANCLGCNANSTLIFDDGRTPPFNATALLSLPPRQRRLQHESDCRCPVNSQYRGPTADEFQSAFNESMATLRLTTNLTSFEEVTEVLEVEQVDCDSNRSTFETTVDLEVLTSSNNLTVATLETLEIEFQESYNTLAERFCDPFFRTIEAVSIINSSVLEEIFSSTPAITRMLQLANDPSMNETNVTDNTNSTEPPQDFTNITNAVTFKVLFTYRVSGRCRGCQSDVQLFDQATRRQLALMEDTMSTPPFGLGRRHRRRLQLDSTCWCAATTITQGAPSEREFAFSFGSQLQTLSQRGQLEEINEVLEVEEILGMAGPLQKPPPECQTATECFQNQEGSLCVANTCLHDGILRFTLQWQGDDDYDLSVLPPTGNLIGWQSTYDATSGGIFDTRGIQTVVGPHVESVYFADKDFVQSGKYEIVIEQFTERDKGDDWTLEVFVMGAFRADFLGTGSDTLVFEFGEDRAMSGCDTGNENVDCCSDADCAVEQTCVSESCVTKGSPQITLAYYGDDDLDLYVRTPGGTTLFYGNRIDAVSGGAFEADSNEGNIANHVQNVYFPMNSSSSSGMYLFWIDSFQKNGVASDPWVTTVRGLGPGRGGTFEGSGDSEIFSFTKDEPRNGASQPQNAGPCNNTIPDVECCSDDDCEGSAICFGRNCVPGGSVQISLAWFGGDTYDIYMISPGLQVVNWENPTDETTEAFLHESAKSLPISYRTEAIIIPEGVEPVNGTYEYGVRLWGERGRDVGEWEISVVFNNTEVVSNSGVGNSPLFSFEIGSAGAAEINSICRPSPSTCCSDIDCRRDSRCVNSRCVIEGSLRFTLAWIGDDIADLIVTTPSGQSISRHQEFDHEATGSLQPGTFSDRSEYKVMNIFFTNRFEVGDEFSMKVETGGRIEEWTLYIVQGGVERGLFKGAGSSVGFTYMYEEDDTKSPSVSLEPSTSRSPEGGLCSTTRSQCCTSSDCAAGKLCLDRTCVQDGALRVSLSFEGFVNDANLIVLAPSGEEISLDHPFATEIGAFFIRSREGRKVSETVIFPFEFNEGAVRCYVETRRPGRQRPGMGPPPRSRLLQPGMWSIEFFVYGHIFQAYEGAGDSSLISLNGNDIFVLSSNPSLVPSTFASNGASFGPSQPSLSPSLAEYPTVSERPSVSSMPSSPDFPSPKSPKGTPKGPVNKVGEDDDGTEGNPDDDEGDPLSDDEQNGDPDDDEDKDDPDDDEDKDDPDDDDDGSECEVSGQIECCFVDDCEAQAATCFANHCLIKGELRITLVWSGNDNLDLTVITPKGNTVSKTSQEDEESGGKYQGDAYEDQSGIHVENIFFPPPAAPGAYTLQVDMVTQMGRKDSWTLYVFEDETLDRVFTGTGQSGKLLFALGRTRLPSVSPSVIFSSGNPSDNSSANPSLDTSLHPSVSNSGSMSETPSFFDASMQPSLIQSAQQSPSPSKGECIVQGRIECCSSNDCDGPGRQVCFLNVCVRAGDLRFTLAWNGIDDLNLAVRTPGGTVVSKALVEDKESGGKYEGDAYSSEPGVHVENVSFPPPVDFGDYVAQVNVAVQIGAEDSWTLRVFRRGDTLAASFTGKGISTPLLYSFSGSGALSAVPSAVPSAVHSTIPSAVHSAIPSATSTGLTSPSGQPSIMSPKSSFPPMSTTRSPAFYPTQSVLPSTSMQPSDLQTPPTRILPTRPIKRTNKQ